LSSPHEVDRLSHPSVEALMQFHTQAEQMPLAERHGIQSHLQICPACREEVSLFLSFSPALVQQWANEATPEHREVRPESAGLRLVGALRSLVWHPGFAYALVVLLSIPLVRSQVASRPGPSVLPSSTSFFPSSAAQQTLEEVLGAPSRGWHQPPYESRQTTELPYPNPQGPAHIALLDTYKKAYEARALATLQQLWQMDTAAIDALKRVFATSRQIALLIEVDEKSLTVRDEGKRMLVPFVQAVTLLDHAGHLSTQGPSLCVADMRRDDSGQWKIMALQDDSQRGGHCQP